MSSNGYELRAGILNEAKGMLSDGWHMQLSCEMEAAKLENRAPKFIAPPDIKDVLALAETMYGFVCKK